MISTRISGPGVEEYAMQLDPAIHLPMDPRPTGVLPVHLQMDGCRTSVLPVHQQMDGCRTGALPIHPQMGNFKRVEIAGWGITVKGVKNKWVFGGNRFT